MSSGHMVSPTGGGGMRTTAMPGPYMQSMMLTPMNSAAYANYGLPAQPIPLSQCHVGAPTSPLPMHHSRANSRTSKRSGSPPHAAAPANAHSAKAASTCNNRKLFVGGLSLDMTEADLHPYYSQFGAVAEAGIIRDMETRMSRGFGFVTFAEVESAERALAARPHTINGRVVDAKKAIPRENLKPGMERHSALVGPGGTPLTHAPSALDPTKIYILNLTASVAPAERDNTLVDDVRKVFQQYGSVQQVEIDVTNKRLPYVVLDSEAAAKRCMAIARMGVQPVTVRGVQLDMVHAIDMPDYIRRYRHEHAHAAAHVVPDAAEQGRDNARDK